MTGAKKIGKAKNKFFDQIVNISKSLKNKNKFSVNSNTKNKIITPNFEKKDLLQNSSITKMSNFFEKFNQDGFYGVDQGIIDKMYTYVKNGTEYSHKEMLKLVNNYNVVKPNFTKKANPEYFELKNKLISQGFTSDEASVILSSLNYKGACSHATVANIIFHQFSDNPDLFKKVFGYSMFKNKNGKLSHNS